MIKADLKITSGTKTQPHVQVAVDQSKVYDEAEAIAYCHIMAMVSLLTRHSPHEILLPKMKEKYEAAFHEVARIAGMHIAEEEDNVSNSKDA